MIDDPRDDQYLAAVRDATAVARRLAEASGARLLSIEPDGPPLPVAVRDWAGGHAEDMAAGRLTHCLHGNTWSMVMFMFGHYPSRAFCASCADFVGNNIGKRLAKVDVAACDICSGFGGGNVEVVILPIGAIVARLILCPTCLIQDVPVS